MGSGLIYAVIIVMWAAYFIPRWLRRHDELSESRSVEKFDNAMRILSRREPTPDKRYVVMPPRPKEHRGAGRPSVPSQRSGASGGGLRTTSPVAVRRRRVLAALLLSALVSGGLAPLTALAWWVPVSVLVATVGFLGHCRLQARTRRDVSRTRVAVRKRSRSRLLRFDAIERLMTVRRELAEERAAEELRWQDSEDAMRRELEAEDERRRAVEAGWSPVPVPLPTYVSKPMAPRPVPTVDLTRPGAWTQAKAADSPRPAPMSALLEDADGAEDQLDDILHPRAVND